MINIFKKSIILLTLFIGLQRMPVVQATIDDTTDGELDVTTPTIYVDTLEVSQTNVKPGDTVKVSLKVTDDMSGVGKWEMFDLSAGDKNGNNDFYFNGNLYTDSYEDGIDLSQGDFTVIRSDVKTGWLQEGSTWYYFKPSGEMATGWEQINGTWYHFNSLGQMQVGWLQEGSTWYYLKSSGAMAIGWEQVNGTWYYFNPLGNMKVGWLQEGSTWYYLKSNGSMVTGWEEINGSWYYFNRSGKMQVGWLQEGSTWYYLKPSGAMAIGWANSGNEYYYFEKSGAMKTGWLKEGNMWYYLKPNGAMATGWQTINNSRYYFYALGVMAENTVIDEWKIGSNGAVSGAAPQKLDFDHAIPMIVDFFRAYNISIPTNDEDWNFSITYGDQGFGNPDDWGEYPVIMVNKYTYRYGFSREEYRYLYCPVLKKGVKVESINNYLTITKYFG